MNKKKQKFKNFLAEIELGEDSSRQFKEDIKRASSLSSEMVAFANTKGGTIYIGVSDDSSLIGLSKKDVKRINQLISNAASQGVRSPITVETKNITLENKRIIIVLKVPQGIDKPYFDKDGVIWLKIGSDKRRINSKEELRRFFQISSQLHADELPTKADIEKLDKLFFRDFLRDVYQLDFPDNKESQIKLLQNINLATESGKLNLAGVLMFAEQPEWIVPQFVLKAISYSSDEIHVSEYIDTEDFSGPLSKVFQGALSFIMRNLRKVQAGQGVNAPGTSEISEAVFEELLVNALVHRDYFINAPIRLFVFNNRIEIISPGHLPNNLTVKKIRSGISNIRNPILVSYVAKGILPYHGLGSGIKRALTLYPNIDFIDSYEKSLFTVVVHRPLSLKEKKSVGKELKKRRESVGKEKKSVGKEKKSVGKELKKRRESVGKEKKSVGKELKKRRERTGKTSEAILKNCRNKKDITILELAKKIGVTERSVQRNIQKLQSLKLLQRIGGRKEGVWKVLDS